MFSTTVLLFTINYIPFRAEIQIWYASRNRDKIVDDDNARDG
jgi:hypothetical protein